MSKNRWKREGRDAGPGNVKDGRWQVQRSEVGWAISDLQTGDLHHLRPSPFGPIGWRTMALAKQHVDEVLAP